MGLLKEFRAFAIKGNMLDMAVGIIIGAAFGGLVRSMVDDLIMPVVGQIWQADFTNLYFPLQAGIRQASAEYAAQHQGTPLPLADARQLGPVIAYGNFTTLLINFLILAFVVFLLVRTANRLRTQFEREEKAVPPPAPPEELLVLREIRDALTRQ